MSISAEAPANTVQGDEQWASIAPPIALLFLPQSISTQISQSLDKDDGHYCQLFGGSSEADPWLLRHCRYDELGFRRFVGVHFRNVGGVPTRDKIPAHFMVSEDEMCDGAREETRITGGARISGQS